MQDEFLRVDLSGLPTPQAHQYLLGAVGPRPIAWASTVDAQGQPNLAPFSYFNVFSTRPPLLIFSPNRSGKENHAKDTHLNVKEVPEVVINTVSYSQVHRCNLTSVLFARGVNEFQEAGLTMLPSEKVRPMRIAESAIQMECAVTQVQELGAHGGAGNLVFCEVLVMHVRKDILDAEGYIDPQLLDLVGRMGRAYYTRANGGAIFSMPHSSPRACIGLGNLPESLRTSPVLTGEELSQLAVQPALPTPEELEAYRWGAGKDLFAQGPTLETLHGLVRSLLQAGRPEEALLLGLAASA